jgi:uncharacterized protein (TIGR02996 family)
MPENAALFDAILAHPAEDTPRLAYADWFDENGDADRARFIRLQFEIEKLPPIGAKASKAKKEEEAALKKHEKKWAGPIAGMVNYYRFRRGFVEFIRIDVADYLKDGERLFELAPLRDVNFDQMKDQMPALAASPLFGRAETLGFSPFIGDQLHNNGRLELLLASPHLAKLRGLNLSTSLLDAKDVQKIASCPYLGELRHLDLSWNQIGHSGMKAIANSPHFKSLTSFELRGNVQIGPAGVQELVDSPLADRLEHLRLVYQKFGDEGVRVLAEGTRLTKLLTLDLSDNDLTDKACGYLEKAPQLASLQRLILRGYRKTIGKDAREKLKKRFGKDACVF